MSEDLLFVGIYFPFFFFTYACLHERRLLPTRYIHRIRYTKVMFSTYLSSLAIWPSNCDYDLSSGGTLSRHLAVEKILLVVLPGQWSAKSSPPEHR